MWCMSLIHHKKYKQSIKKYKYEFMKKMKMCIRDSFSSFLLDVEFDSDILLALFDLNFSLLLTRMLRLSIMPPRYGSNFSSNSPGRNPRFSSLRVYVGVVIII